MDAVGWEVGACEGSVKTGIAGAEGAGMMATDFRLDVEAGVLASKAVPGNRSSYARATSPLSGFLEALA